MAVAKPRSRFPLTSVIRSVKYEVVSRKPLSGIMRLLERFQMFCARSGIVRPWLA